MSTRKPPRNPALIPFLTALLLSVLCCATAARAEVWRRTGLLAAAPPQTNAALGSSVAVSSDGSVAVAGSPARSVAFYQSGAVHVFSRPAGGWRQASETALLTASDAGYGDELGNSVAVSADGGTIAAGAPQAGGGAVYVFLRPPAGWTDGAQAAKLTSSDASGNDYLGFSVAMSADGSLIAAGADGRDGAGGDRGAVYLFARPPTGWADATQTAILTASDTANDQRLGYTVAVSPDGSTVAAYAPLSGLSGKVYVWEKPLTGWADATQDGMLTNPSGLAGDLLGRGLALSQTGSLLAAGAPGWDSTWNDRGAVFLFNRPVGGWADTGPAVRLNHCPAAAGDMLGMSVALRPDGTGLAAGAPYARYGAADAGAAYYFTRPASGWAGGGSPTALFSILADQADQVGWCTALAGGGLTMVLGAPQGGSPGTSGRAHVFEWTAIDPFNQIPAGLLLLH